MSEAFERNVLTTYRTLRVAMIPLLLILLVATALESTRGPDCLLGSISAYFHTPVRGAFVFSLAALGACLIAYKGNDAVEDVLLNFAGFMAFLVALVPTKVDGSCPTKYGKVVADAGTSDAVRNNVLTLLIVSAVFLLMYRCMPRQVEKASTRKGLKDATPFSKSLKAAFETVGVGLEHVRERDLTRAQVLGVVAAVIVLIELAMFIFWPNTFKDSAHGISAATMVLGVLGVMVTNAYDFASETVRVGKARRPWTNRYGVTAAATLVLIAVAIGFFRSGEHLILVVELVVIVGFIAFWYLQTRELWFYSTREEKSAEVGRQLESAASDAARRPGLSNDAAKTTALDGSAAPAQTMAHDESAGATPLTRTDLYKVL
ncbi:MAG: hypothetical protein L0H96_04280 [Humibacillus sp.]|nr:hypothetical protein [Humibacillus sp.]MDN5776107.1 hypothetical protein [Humibacillus sp.]